MNTTPWLMALAGGLLIGLSATLLLLMNGRIAGISNIIGGLWSPSSGENGWRWAFAAGLLIGGMTVLVVNPESFGQPDASLYKLGMAGFLVGLGTCLGNGCTSGHGVCGLSRRSFRSLVATLVFIVVAMMTVFFRRHLFGDAQT